MNDIFDILLANSLTWNLSNTDTLRNFANSDVVEAYRKPFITEHAYFQPIASTDQIVFQFATNRDLAGILVYSVNYTTDEAVPHPNCIELIYTDSKGTSWYNATLPIIAEGKYRLELISTHTTYNDLVYYTDWFEVSSKYSDLPLIQYCNTDDSVNDGTKQPILFSMRANCVLFDITNKFVNDTFEGYDKTAYPQLYKDRRYYKATFEPCTLTMADKITHALSNNVLKINGQEFTKLEGFNFKQIAFTNMYDGEATLTDKNQKTYDQLTTVDNSNGNKTGALLSYDGTNPISYDGTNPIAYN